MGESDAESRAKIDEFNKWLQENDSPEVQEQLHAFMQEGIGRLEADVADLRRQIGTEYDLLPLSYIAKHYFGKSKAWLFQRINGYRVRGKVYTLSEEQKAIFNEAVQDIAKFLYRAKTREEPPGSYFFSRFLWPFQIKSPSLQC